jgi:hypothetical protein
MALCYVCLLDKYSKLDQSQGKGVSPRDISATQA